MSTGTTPARYLSFAETAALILSLFFVGVSFGGSSPLVSAILESRGFSEYFTGAVVAVLSLGLALFSPLAGRLVDRFGPRPVNVTGLVAQGLGFAALGLALAWDERGLFAARIWLGVAAAMTFVAAEYALLKGTRPTHRARVMAAYGTGFGLGFMLGVFVSHHTFAQLGLWCFPLLTGVALAIAPVAHWGMRSVPRPDPFHDPDDPNAVLSWRPILIGLYGALVYAVLDVAMTGTYPVEGQRLGLSRAQSLEVVGWMAFGAVVAQPVSGFLADRFGNRRVLFSLCGLGLAAALVAGTSSARGIASNLAIATVALCLVGCAAGGVFPVGLALLGERTPTRLLSRANARFSVVFGYASMAAPVLAAGFIDGVERIGLLGWAVPSLAISTFALALPLAWLEASSRHCWRK